MYLGKKIHSLEGQSQVEKKNSYRLGIDLGTNSIGTALIKLDGEGVPCGILHMGSRIFTDNRDPKTGEAPAVTRRLARAMRRRRDRYLKRRGRLTQVLVKEGLFPKKDEERKQLESLDPYAIRAKALYEKVDPFEIGRALFHINQRRGFKSNRKTDKRGDADETGAINEAVKKLPELLKAEKCHTLGEYLYNRKRQGLSTRCHMAGTSKKDHHYEFYPTRKAIEEEIDAIWESQARFDGKFFDKEKLNRVKDPILFQRNLRPVDPGKCFLEPDEKRAPMAHPVFQDFRLLQELNHLRLEEHPGDSERPLTLDERNALYEALSCRSKMTFAQMRKLIKMPSDARFTIEDDKRKELKGNVVVATISDLKKGIGGEWKKFDVAEQCEIVQRLLDDEDTPTLVEWLVSGKGLSKEMAEKLADCPLPEGFASLSLKAMDKILPFLREEVITYDKACKKAGYDHSAEDACGGLNRLPYYGELLFKEIGTGSGSQADPPEKRYGKLPNPTVHVGMNQLRRVVNCLIKHYGMPDQIVLEVARDLKMSQEEKKELEKKQAENQKRNDEIREELEKHGLPPTAENMLRLQLYREQQDHSKSLAVRCPYSGKTISESMLFSDEVEIDHILPFSRTLDDSRNNKTLCLREWNRMKTNQSPYEAFGKGKPQEEYDAIRARAVEMFPAAKSKRFAVDAMEQWEARDADSVKEFGLESAFLARQLVDTAYLAKLARKYLIGILPKERIWVVPGRLTAMLRGKWGLNEIIGTEQPDGTFKKNRDDHRHHAIDALVIGLSDRSTLQKISTLSAKNKLQNHRLLEEFMPPWDGFQHDVREKVGRIVVSHRVDHGAEGSLHLATAYGFAGESEKGTLVVHRVPISTLTNMKSLEGIRHDRTRRLLQSEVQKKTNATGNAEFQKALAEVADKFSIKSVRIVGVENKYVEIGNPPYKLYTTGANYCYDLDTRPERWTGTIVSRYDANRPGFAAEPPKGIVRLRAGDTLEIADETGNRHLMRLRKMSMGRVWLDPIYEGNCAARDEKNKEKYGQMDAKSAAQLQKMSARKVFIDEAGFVYRR